MSKLNALQTEFMHALAAIQEERVQISLCQNRDHQSLENLLYDVTFDVIVSIMELFDGYTNANIGKLTVICEKSGDCLKDNPHIELHDVVCDYLKASKE